MTAETKHETQHLHVLYLTDEELDIVEAAVANVIIEREDQNYPRFTGDHENIISHINGTRERSRVELRMGIETKGPEDVTVAR